MASSASSKPSFAKVLSSGRPPSRVSGSRPTASSSEPTTPSIKASVRSTAEAVATRTSSSPTVEPVSVPTVVDTATDTATTLDPASDSATVAASADSNAAAGAGADADADADASSDTAAAAAASADPANDAVSIVSQSTCTLDEKESLRPDDSASIRAADEDSASASAEGRPQLAIPNGWADPRPNHRPAMADEAPDEKILESLHSHRDRVWVLKLEQDVLDFVKNSDDVHLELPQCNSFYRMLAHRLADYYNLGHSVDPTGHAVVLYKTPNHRLPPLLSTLVAPLEPAPKPATTVPARIIMRRSGATAESASGTTASSVSPSKTPSDAGAESSSDTGHSFESKPKVSLSRQEREAKYREVRQRIFGDSEPGAPSPDHQLDQALSRASPPIGKKKFRKPRRFDGDGGFDPRFSHYPSHMPPMPPGMPNMAGPYYNGLGYGGADASGMMGQYPPGPPTMGPYGGGPPAGPYGHYPGPPDGQHMYGGYGQPDWAGPVDHQSGPYSSPYNYQMGSYDPSMELQQGVQPFHNSGSTDPSHHLPSGPGPHQFPSQYPPQWPTSPVGAGGPPPIIYPSYHHHWAGNTSSPRQYGGPGHGRQFNPQSQSYIPSGVRSGSRSSVNSTNPGKAYSRRSYGRPDDGTASHSSKGIDNRPMGSPAGSHRSPIATMPFPRSSALFSPGGGSSSGSGRSSATNPGPPSSIAKWGVPSHLPPKPPLPASMEPPKHVDPGRDCSVRSSRGTPTKPSGPSNVSAPLQPQSRSNGNIVSTAAKSPKPSSATASSMADATTPVPRHHLPLTGKIVFGALEPTDIESS